MSEDRCICCGEIVPEGRMVCPNCEAKLKDAPLTLKPIKNLSHGEMVQIAEEKRRFPPDYIDRRKLTAEMMKLIPTRLYTEEDMLDLVNEQPRADVVAVIKCRKCKWWNEKKRVCEHPEWTEMDGWHKATDAEDYCFRAERKETFDGTSH